MAACAPASASIGPEHLKDCRAASCNRSNELAVGRQVQAECDNGGSGYGARLMPVERSIQSSADLPYRRIAQSRLPP